MGLPKCRHSVVVLFRIKPAVHEADEGHARQPQLTVRRLARGWGCGLASVRGLVCALGQPDGLAN